MEVKMDNAFGDPTFVLFNFLFNFQFNFISGAIYRSPFDVKCRQIRVGGTLL